MSNYWDVPFPLQGGCSCGLLRYSLSLPPIIVHCCHCTACQRQLGTAFAINAVIESSALKFLPPARPSIAGNAETPSAPCGVNAAFASTTGGVAVPPSNSPDTLVTPVLITVPTESQLGQTQVQCPSCHTTVWNYYCDSGDQSAYLRVGTLDTPWVMDPDVHIFTANRRSFVAIDDGKPQFEGYYPDRSVFYRPDTLKRVAALTEKADAWRSELKKKLGM